MPIIAMMIGKPEFSGLMFTINDAVYRYGAFDHGSHHFVSTAPTIFFFVVKPLNALMARAEARRGGSIRRGAPPSGAARRDQGVPLAARDPSAECVQPDRQASWELAHLLERKEHPGDERFT